MTAGTFLQLEFGHLSARASTGKRAATVDSLRALDATLAPRLHGFLCEHLSVIEELSCVTTSVTTSVTTPVSTSV